MFLASVTIQNIRRNKHETIRSPEIHLCTGKLLFVRQGGAWRIGGAWRSG